MLAKSPNWYAVFHRQWIFVRVVVCLFDRWVFLFFATAGIIWWGFLFHIVVILHLHEFSWGNLNYCKTINCGTYCFANWQNFSHNASQMWIMVMCNKHFCVCSEFCGPALSEYLQKCCAMCLNYKEFAACFDIWQSAKQLSS